MHRSGGGEAVPHLIGEAGAVSQATLYRTHIYAHFTITYKWFLIHSTYYLTYSLLSSVQSLPEVWGQGPIENDSTCPVAYLPSAWRTDVS